jgi:hypothetical protein
MRSGLVRAVVTGLAVLVALSLAWFGLVIWSLYTKTPFPTDDRCTAEVDGYSVSIDPEQAHNASIIAGVAGTRGLSPRAVSIALATAYQESGIRNLDHGHADSLGLFQQRPSQGWGTAAQVTDPYYSSRAFYRALVKVKGWETRDLNDVAQAVQRSAYPEAYRKHLANARALGSALSGQTPASFSCFVAEPKVADALGMAKFLIRTLGSRAEVKVTEAGVSVVADSSRLAWSAAHVAVANSGRYGLTTVVVGASSWRHNPRSLAAWRGEVTKTRTVLLGFTS